VKAVAETSTKGHEDADVVALAEKENRIVITLDIGFGSIYYFSKRGKVGMIILRIHPPTIEDVNLILMGFLKRVNLDERNLTKSLVILDRKKYRILR
jgi:predicted nuclease of predicted toxin-antitoxin system